MRTLVLAVLSLSWFAVFPARSYASAFGTVTCVIHDPDHRPVAGATVTLRARAADWSRTAVTGAAGDIRLAAVPVGDYALDVELAGFEPAHLALTVLSDASPVVHVQLHLAAVSQAVRVSGTPEALATGSMAPVTIVDRDDVAGTPGASRTNSLSFITAFVPGAYVTHDQLHVRGGHQVSWLLDGVPVPNTNIGSNVGPQVDPKDADYIQVFRGGYEAQYGDRTYAVFNVVPRTGFERSSDAELILSAGSYWQTNDEASVGGHTERFAYYASVSGNRSGLGLEPPQAEILHDRQSGLSGFNTLIFNVNPGNQLRVVTSIRGDRYEVPNTPGAEAAGVHDVQRESDQFAAVTWARSFRSGTLVSVSPFFHRNATRLDGSDSGSPVSALDHHASQYAGAQATLGTTAGRHSWQVGFYGFQQRDRQVLDVRFEDGGRPGVAVREGPRGHLVSLFAQDTYRATSWVSVTAGLRRTRFSGAVAEDATSPRVGVSIRVPALGWVVRGFYGRFYQEPPLGTVSGPVLDVVDALNLSWIPLHGERDEEVQAGVLVPLRTWSVDANVFRTKATNFFDHNSLGNSNVFLPLTIDGARIRGVELAVRSPRGKGTRVHAAYSYQVAEGRGGVSGGLTDFSAAEGVFALDHDQRHTLSAGIDARLPNGIFAAANTAYGSGFPDAGGPARLAGHTTADATIGRTFGERLSVSATATNVTNRRLLIDNSPTFGGTHFNHPREIYAQIRYRFHY